MKDNEQNLLIRDFNARIGQERTTIWGNDRDKIRRKPKDGIINIEGKRLLEEREKRLEYMEWEYRRR